jgi:hypothetical protein
MLNATPVIAMRRLCSISARWSTVSGLGSEVDVESVVVWSVLADGTGGGGTGGVSRIVGLSFPTNEEYLRRVRKAAFVLALVACRSTAEPEDAAAIVATTTIAAPIATTSAAPSGKTYTVRIKRAGHVGDGSHLSVDDDHVEHTITRIAAGTSKDERKPSRAHIEGTTRVLALQEDGTSALRDEMTVTEFWGTKSDGPKITFAPAGARVVIERGATKRDAHVTIDGRAASKDVIEALDHLTSLTMHKGPSDDDVFGTKVPQPVGAEWPVDGALAEKDLRTRDMVIPPGSVTGSTKLVAARALRGVDCLEIDNHMTISALQSMGELPPGSSIKNARIDVHVHMMLPIDEKKTALETQMDMTIAGVFTVPTPKGPVEVELDSTDHKRASELP